MPSGYRKNGSKLGFQKGHKQLPECKKGWFKKGHRHQRRKKYGTICNGYIMIFQPKHPFCNKAGYIKRSRLIMEKMIGRYLKPEERMHHINGIKDDDRSENLKLFPNESRHQEFHHPKGTTF